MTMAVATYSSRGPTRSYWVDADGIIHHDNLLKPDLVAPGNNWSLRRLTTISLSLQIRT